MENRGLFVAGVVLGLGALAMLTACGKDSSARGIYHCERGVVIDVTFTEGQRVDIKSGEAAYRLMRVENTKVPQYEGDESVFISRGVEATFAEAGKKPVRCRRN